MATYRLQNKFVWEEEIPEIRKKGDIFRDRILVVTTNGGKTIKFSTSFTYDLPEIHLKVKVVKGAAMMAGFAKGQAGFEKLELKYTLERNSGYTTTESWNYAGFAAVHSTKTHPKFDLIFCNGNRGKKVTYSLSTNFDVFKIEEEPMLYNCLKLPELIYYRKELSDIKLICEGKIFECHKLVLSCRSNVFQAMFKSNSTTEAKTGKVEIVDFKSKTVANMVYFMYHDSVVNEENMDSALLILAEKYNVLGLMNYCVKYFEENLSLENALDILVSSHLTNQKRLFDAATKFAIENKGRLVKTEAWKELLKTNPKLASKITMTMLQLE